MRTNYSLRRMPLTATIALLFFLLFFVTWQITRNHHQWSYEYYSINSRDVLAFYEPSIFFVFLDIEREMRTSNTGCFPVSGKTFRDNTLASYKNINGVKSTYSYNYSPLFEKGVWRINDHVIKISNAGKQIVIDGQLIEWSPRTCTIVKVNASGIHLVTVLHKTVLVCPCPATVRNPENEDSEAETGLKSQEDSDSVDVKSE